MRGGRGGRGLSQWEQLCTWSPNKLWRSNSMFNLWFVSVWLGREAPVDTQSNIGYFFIPNRRQFVLSVTLSDKKPGKKAPIKKNNEGNLSYNINYHWQNNKPVYPAVPHIESSVLFCRLSSPERRKGERGDWEAWPVEQYLAGAHCNPRQFHVL